MVCPYCKQGEIIKARLKVNNSIISICEECDTVWKENEKISNTTGKGFEFIASEQKIKPVWDELEVL